MRSSRIEKTELLKSWAAISIAFAIVMNGLSATPSFLIAIIISALTVGLGFLAHELSHKYFAQKYGYWAEYRSSNPMLVLMILMSFLGFIFAAPGGVLIQGHISTSRNGKISAAGPAASLILGVIFLILYLALPKAGIIGEFTRYGMIINCWLALFNLLPFLNFDGKKVLAWNKPAYYGMMGIAVILTVFAFSI